jgi:putative transposase
MKKKRHTPEEIAAKLRQADEMVEHGRLHSEVAKTLGVSVMTYHRWRKARAAGVKASPEATAGPRHRETEGNLDARLSALELENSRLRRLVTDLLLEKVRLEEMLGPKRSSASGR